MSDTEQTDSSPFNALTEQIDKDLNALDEYAAKVAANQDKIYIRAMRTGVRINPAQFRNRDELSSAIDLIRRSLHRTATEVKQQLEVETARLRSDLNEAKETELRAVAEAENTRARLKREEKNIQRRAIRPIAEKLMTVADNFERTTASLQDLEKQEELKAFTDGVNLSVNSFTDALNRSGIQSFNDKDVAFDPEIHEAIALVPTPGVEEETVIDIQRTGYKWNDELLRPAQVIVGKPIPTEETDAAKEESS